MARSLHAFNALLVLVALGLGIAVVRVVLDDSPAGGRPPAPTVAATAITPEKVRTEPPASPTEGADVLLRQQPFGKPLPPPPPPPPEPPRAAPPPPPAAPLPTLIGTMSVGHESRALMKDGSRTDLFAVGDAVAAGTVLEIHPDRVIIKREEALGEIVLRSSTKAAPSDGSSAPATLESAPTGEPTEPERPRRARRWRAPVGAPTPGDPSR
jgi:Type II secretion system protein C